MIGEEAMANTSILAIELGFAAKLIGAHFLTRF